MNDTTTEPAPPPPSSDRPGARPPLVRRRRGRMLAGVAMGVARHLRIDVTLVRIGFVILAFIGGAGVIGYVAGWILLPEEDDGTAEPATWSVERGAPFWIGVGLLGLAAIVLVEHTMPFGSSVGAPLVLIAIGAALWKVSQDRADRPPAAARPVPAAQTVDAPGGDETATAAPATDWTPPPPPRSRSILGRLTLGVLLVALGAGALLDQLDVVRFTALDVAATALTVIGAGLVVGAWFGRARWLIAVGILLLPFVAVAGFLEGTGIDVRAGAGERFHEVSSTGGLAATYSLGAGYLELDLTDVDVPSAGARTDIRLGAGEIVLLVPEDTNVVVDASVQVGELDLPGLRRSGPGLAERFELGSAADPGGTLVIDVELGVGALSVRLVPSVEERR